MPADLTTRVGTLTLKNHDATASSKAEHGGKDGYDCSFQVLFTSPGIRARLLSAHG